MNTRASVVYGWGVLIAGAAIAYGMAKPSIDERRRIATENGQRPLEIKTWQQRVAESERAVMDNLATPDPQAKAAAQIGAIGNPGESGTSGLGAGLEHAGRGVGVGDGQGKK
ncbi:hypothetical protein FFLO_05767 [Filobasidium floriforme]|uniref:Uncharacterized protein n=1 Tax=Filobasidium floriforme TaxID=5210 RepID=A0A8K0JG87_9TREE|nr:uncharacterized protein HD553DRAFT_317610 [Filobasidium floriforme]KAG7529180.1 hypothetical protein FFLO_05767 [Filobasidium floriforme]KAH8080173.1 hypothetical protein HD553DRAFT_317610 [Filobasidium floriforme]